MSEKMVFRSILINRESVDLEKRTVDVAFSSEKPVERYDGYEVLGHNPGEVDLDFLGAGSAPLLKDHEQEKQIGVIESVRVEDGVGRATVRFGKSGLAAEIFDDVVDGIRKNISVGYVVKEKKTISTDNGVQTYRVTRWQPMEISIVSIPADTSVGVGRSNDPTTKTTKEEKTMAENKKETSVETPAINVDSVRAEARNEELKRVRGIMGVAEKFGMAEAADEFISTGKSVDEFRTYVLDNVQKPQDIKASSDAEIGLTEKEKREYSVMRAVRAMAFPNEAKFQKEAAFELEASRAAAERAGVTPEGVMLPHDILTRDLTAIAAGSPASEGSNLVGTDLMGGSFIDMLRNKMVVKALGARVLSGLNGNVAIPRQSGASTAYWVAEGSAPTESGQSIDQVTMTPKTVGAYTDFTRQLLLQSSVDVERMVMDDIATVLAIAMDHAALYGTGSNGQPTGIANTSGINAPTNFAAAVPTFAEVVAMETAVSVDNALAGNLAYLTDPTTRGGLKTKAKDSGSGLFVWEGDMINGYAGEVSSQVTAGDVFFGNWADLLIGLWGGLDLTIDPYALSTSGGKRIVALQSCDIAVRHPVSFAFNNDGV